MCKIKSVNGFLELFFASKLNIITFTYLTLAKDCKNIFLRIFFLRITKMYKIDFLIDFFFLKNFELAKA